MARLRASAPSLAGTRSLAALALCGVLVALAGCGGSSSPKTTEIQVAAATAFETPMREYASALKTIVPHYTFGGSGAQAQQLEQGFKPDVFVSSNLKLPAYLHEQGLVEEPVVFAGNTLVIAVKKASPITGIENLEQKGVSIAIGSDASPVGPTTRQMLVKIPPAVRKTLVANVKVQETTVKGIIKKLTAGTVDAGIVFATDVRTAGGVLRAIPLPAALQIKVSYEAAVVKDTSYPKQAREFVAGLVKGAGQEAFVRAGYLPASG